MLYFLSSTCYVPGTVYLFHVHHVVLVNALEMLSVSISKKNYASCLILSDIEANQGII